MDWDESDTDDDYIDNEYDTLLTNLIKILLNLRDPVKESFINAEIEFIKKSVLDCLSYILGTEDVLRDSKAFNDGKIYRAGLLRDVDNSFMPLGKAISKNCGDSDENEAVWFSSTNLDHYMELRIKKENENSKNGEKVYGIQTCKTFKKDDSLKFINLSSRDIKLCNGTPLYLLNKDLQFLFNKCLIIPLIRNYSSAYAYNKTKKIELYDKNTFFKNKKIKIDKHVPGYPCAKEKNKKTTTIYDVLHAWDYNTGTRNSFFNEDRIQITLLFQFIDIFNRVLEYKQRNIQILGWTCENTPTSKCELFHSELAIAIKYLQGELRTKIFEKDNDNCSVKIVKPTIVGGQEKRKLSNSSTNSRKKPKVLENVVPGHEDYAPSEFPEYDPDDTPYGIQSVSHSSSRNKSDTHIVPINPVVLTDPFNNYEDDVVPDMDTVPDIDSVPDSKIKDINDFLFGDIEKIKQELSESTAGGSKRKTTRKRKIKRKRKRKATRKHYR